MSRLSVALRLGRVSNLPTTWSNVVSGLVLAGAPLEPIPSLLLCAAVSLFYTGGMYLNDAFDREIDRRERPERPIPSGQVRASTVFAAGFGMLALGVALVAIPAYGLAGLPAGQGAPPLLAALALAAAIVGYDMFHKQNPLSPLLMAVCRVLIYILAALSHAPSVTAPVAWGCVALLGYLIGLTYVAKQENLRAVKRGWPLLFLALPFLNGAAFDHALGVVCYGALLCWVLYTLTFLWNAERRSIPRAVTQFIAGISLLDALLVAGQGAVAAALLCFAAFVATCLLQRVVPGT